MNELYHHGVKGMKWGVRRNDYVPKGRSSRGSSEDISEKNYGEYKRLLKKKTYTSEEYQRLLKLDKYFTSKPDPTAGYRPGGVRDYDNDPAKFEKDGWKPSIEEMNYYKKYGIVTEDEYNQYLKNEGLIDNGRKAVSKIVNENR